MDPDFEGKTDRYNGVTVDSQQEPCGQEQFPSRLVSKYLTIQ